MLGINGYKYIILIWLIAEVHSEDTKFTFRCKNGAYISDDAFCWGPGGIRCGDFSDRLTGCNSDCGAHYWCDGICQDLSIRCNTIADCADGLDELDCGDEINVNTRNCTFQAGKFLCDDHLRCLDENYMCDGHCQCFDCSDEKSGCLTDGEMEEIEKKDTSQVCFKTPYGPHCCSVFDFDTLFEKCTKNQRNQCEQKCVRFGKQSRCLCDENYIGIEGTNNKKCTSNEEASNTLIYDTGTTIGIVDLSTNTSRVINNTNITASTGAHDYIYFATYNNGRGHIFKTSTTSNQTIEILISDSKTTITSLAINWILNQTYYTNGNAILACSTDGKFCRPLKSCNAYSISLAPRFGLMFWVETKNDDNSTQYIMKSAMDGSNETILTIRARVPWPIQISVDELTEKVYFWTNRVELSFISFDGQFQNAFQPTTFPPTQRGVFSTFETKVYFAPFTQNHIYVGNITSGLKLSSLLISFPKSPHLKNLFAYNSRLQRTTVSNKCGESCADGLCLLRPFSSRSELDHDCVYTDINRNWRIVQKDFLGFRTVSRNYDNDIFTIRFGFDSNLDPVTESSSKMSVAVNFKSISEPDTYSQSAFNSHSQSAFNSHSQSAFNSHSQSSFDSHSTRKSVSDSENLVPIVLCIGIVTVCITVGILMLLFRYVPALFKTSRTIQIMVPLQSRQNNQQVVDINESPDLNEESD